MEINENVPRIGECLHKHYFLRDPLNFTFIVQRLSPVTPGGDPSSMYTCRDLSIRIGYPYPSGIQMYSDAPAL